MSLYQLTSGFINRLLMLDEEAMQALSIHSGKTVGIALSNTGTRVKVLLEPEGIRIEELVEKDADVTIRATPTELLRYSQSMYQGASVRSGSIEISGDISLAQDLLGIMRKLDIDWEDHLSRYVGDSIAHKTGRILSETRHFTSSAGKSISSNISEYLRYETGSLVTINEIEEFFRSVDEARNGAERLKARLSKLKSSD